MKTANVTRTPTSAAARATARASSTRRHGSVKAGVMRHHRSRSAARGAAESAQRREIGIDRGHRAETQEPALERLVGAAERSRRQGATVVVRIDQRRHRETFSLGHGGRRNGGDAAVFDRDVDRRPGGRAVSRQQYDARDDALHVFGSSMTLIWAATMRQPSGKRTQVCICRPTLPGAESRRNRVAEIAQSRP